MLRPGEVRGCSKGDSRNPDRIKKKKNNQNRRKQNKKEMCSFLNTALLGWTAQGMVGF